MDAVKRATACLNEIKAKAPQSEKMVVDRLLSDELEMKSVWEELDRLFPPLCAQQFFVVIDCIVGTAAHNSRDKLKVGQGHLQDAKAELEKISEKAKVLADLLRSYRSHCEKAQVSGSGFDIVDCLDRWAADAICDTNRPRWLPCPNLYRDFLREGLEPVRRRYDGKYWPNVDDLLDGLSIAANDSNLTAGCTVTAAGRLTREVSARSFIYVLLEVLRRNGLGNGPLPRNFELTSGSVAKISNCALGLVGNQVTQQNAGKAIAEFKYRQPDN